MPVDDCFDMAQRDRLTIDLSGLREDLETCRDDVAWQELSVNQKVRVALREWIDIQQKENPQSGQTEGKS